MSKDIAPLLKLTNLSVCYGKDENKVYSLRNVDLKIAPSECVGIAGESGCGKSTLALSVMKLLPKNAQVLNGHCYYNNEDILNCSARALQTIRTKKIAMIFQNPMSCLNPFKKIGEQVGECFKIHTKLSMKEIQNEVIGLLEQVKFEDPIRVMKSYPHELSGGMCQRVMIAMAISQKPDLLIADEPTTALDVTTQKDILDLLNELRVTYKMSMMFITHDLAVLSKLSDRIVVMYAGEIVEMAPVDKFFKEPKHPYSINLIKACPTLRGVKEESLSAISGLPPNLKDIPERCAFLPRCTSKQSICEEENVSLKSIDSRLCRCHFFENTSSP
jgi:oligopeptide/dipeptide ABC transporter ATP-binding protein